MKLSELTRAVDKLNEYICEITHINSKVHTDLHEQFEQLCKEMEEDKTNE